MTQKQTAKREMVTKFLLGKYCSYLCGLSNDDLSVLVDTDSFTIADALIKSASPDYNNDR